MIVWNEQKGNNHFWSYKASGILCSFFCFSQLCLFPKEEPKGGLVFFYRYESHGSGEMMFSFVQIESFLFLVHVNTCFPHHDAFWFLKNKNKKLSHSFIIGIAKVLLPLLWRKRCLISQFKYFCLWRQL